MFPLCYAPGYLPIYLVLTSGINELCMIQKKENDLLLLRLLRVYCVVINKGIG